VSQLKIVDLNFLTVELPTQSEVKGGYKAPSVSVASAVAYDVGYKIGYDSVTYGAAAASAAAVQFNGKAKASASAKVTLS